jgi:hypothetical protein
MYCLVIFGDIDLYIIRNKYNSMAQVKEIAIPVKFSDKVRALKIGQSLDITGKERGSTYTHACNSFPAATFITRKIDGKVHLFRTA